MIREEEEAADGAFSAQKRSDSQGVPGQKDGARAGSFSQRRSPSHGGIRQPTIFKRSDSQDKAGAALAQAAGLPRPTPPATSSQEQPDYSDDKNQSELESSCHKDQKTENTLSSISSFLAPREKLKVASRPGINDLMQVKPGEDSMNIKESLLATPSASEKKQLLSSLLSDDELVSSTFEPPLHRGVTASGRKKPNRASIAAVSTTAQKDNVKVVIRVRPINEREKAGGSLERVKLCLSVERNEKIILDRGMDQKTFTFDYVATQDSEQSVLFEKIAKPIADSCLQGYNGTIFAYGQTGSGKTFTIQGPTMLVNGEETLIGTATANQEMHEKRGLMQRSFEYIFECMEREKMEAQKQGIEMLFLVKSSYLEIYNEQIMDLLDPQSYNLHVREDIKKGVYVEGLNEESVSGVKDMMNLTTRGARNRHVGSTLMNKESSRSHSVLTTTIESKTMNDDGVWQIKASRFHIIDLAGSERSKNTNAVGERLKEAGMINKSLTALGIVINSLVEVSEGKKRHVHYRDSKLTFLLRDSLGGNSKTVIIANVTAAAISVGETLSTLKFAQRAKLIKNKAVINEESSSTIHLLKQELRTVKKHLAEQTNQLKKAHEQIQCLRESIPEVHNESINEQPQSSLCRACKRELSGQEDDLHLHFVNTSTMNGSLEGALHSSALLETNTADSSLLDLINEKTPGGTAVGMQNLQQLNPKAFKMYKLRMTELTRMKERVGKVEKLLAENLDNMDIQQKQYEQQIENLTKSNKEKQTALEASEKHRARDKMIIKFREERIAELEARLAKMAEELPPKDAFDNCLDCEYLKKQLANAQTEIAKWVECADRNPQAAKLFAEKQELLQVKQSLQNELKVTPESLTARIRGLNEMTNDLNAYLKEYCLSEGFDRLKLELETCREELATKVEAYEAALAEKEQQHGERVRSLGEEHEDKVASLHEKLEVLRATFEDERARIEQVAQDQMQALRADLDATLAEKGELQKEIFDKLEAHEKQQQLQKQIDLLGKTMEELQTGKDQLASQLSFEKEERDKLSEQLRQTETALREENQRLVDEFEAQKDELDESLKDVQQRANREISDLEKEVAVTKEEIRMQEEQNADLERQLNSIQLENDALQKQVLESQEEMQEKRRHVKEIEVKLNVVIRDMATKTDQLNDCRLKLSAKETQEQKLCAQIDRMKEESAAVVAGLEDKIAQVTLMKDRAESQAERHAQSVSAQEKVLLDQTSRIESKVKECARFEAESASFKKTIEELQQNNKSLEAELARSSEALETAKAEQKSKQEEYDDVKVQVTAMEELTVSLTQQQLEKESQIALLNASVAERDQQMAKTLKELDETSKKLNQSLVEEKRRGEELSSKVMELSKALEASETTAATITLQLQGRIDQLQLKLSNEKEELTREAQTAKAVSQDRIKEAERKVEILKEAMLAETEAIKNDLELKYQSQLQSKEIELKKTMVIHQGKNEEQVQAWRQEAQKLQSKLDHDRQLRLATLINLLDQVRLLKQDHQQLANTVTNELTIKKICPKLSLIGNLIDRVKAFAAERSSLQLDCQELAEQLVEYKGLTQQLQEEKRSLNSKLHESNSHSETSQLHSQEIIQSLNLQLQTTQTELAEAHQMLSQQKTVAEESIRLLNQQRVDQYQKLTEESRQVIERLSEEAEQLRHSRAEAQNELLKYKTKTSEQSNLLLTSKETISNMVNKENQLMTDLKKKISELGEQQDHYKARVTQYKQEKEAITSKYETLRKENENLRELIKIKDGQIEDARGYEQDRRAERERLYNDVKKQKEMLTKRENEIKELVLTLKAFADEKKRLEKENERIRNQEMSIGHNNQAQKIQHHLRIKEENNKLREENYQLQDQLRRLQPGGGAAALNSNATFGNLAHDAILEQQSQQIAAEMEKSRKELTSMHEAVAALAENLLKLPGVGQFVSSNDQLATHFKKQVAAAQGTNSTSSATYYAKQKLKGTSEVIVHICKQLQARISECNQMTQEFKQMEQEIHQLQLERSVLLQANPQLAQQVPRMSLAQGGNAQQASGSSGSTMQPSFQVQQPQQRSITQQQQQSLASGQSTSQLMHQQTNQYRRQSSRGAPQSQETSQFSSQPNLQTRQSHLVQQPARSSNRM